MTTNNLLATTIIIKKNYYYHYFYFYPSPLQLPLSIIAISLFPNLAQPSHSLAAKTDWKLDTSSWTGQDKLPFLSEVALGKVCKRFCFYIQPDRQASAYKLLSTHPNQLLHISNEHNFNARKMGKVWYVKLNGILHLCTKRTTRARRQSLRHMGWAQQQWNNPDLGISILLDKNRNRKYLCASSHTSSLAGDWH